MKKQILLIVLMACSVAGFTQKRNMFPAYSFDIKGENIVGTAASGALFVRECFNGGDIAGIIDENGITGKSLKVEIKTMPTSKTRWDNALKYFIEVFTDDVLEIRFKAKADRATAFHFELYTAAGTGNALYADEIIDVTTEVKEYVFKTAASTGHTIQRMTLQFGAEDTEEGSIFYFDDLSITKVNTDWDGNLVRNGGFEIPTINFSFIDYNQDSNHHTFAFDDIDALGNGQALKISNLRSGADWNGNIKSYYFGSGINYEVSYKARNAGQTGGNNSKVAVGRAWDPGSTCFGINPYPGDGFAWQTTLTATTQSLEYTYIEDAAKDEYNNHFMYMFGWYFVGDFWIDDLKVEQTGLTKINIVEWERTDNTVQLWVNASPSSANNKVTWTIDAENSTGEGTIDTDGLLTVTKAGIIKVNAESTYKDGINTSVDIDCSAMQPTSINETIVQKEILSTEYFTLTGISLGKSPEGLEGIYLQKTIYNDGLQVTEKIYKQK